MNEGFEKTVDKAKIVANIKAAQEKEVLPWEGSDQHADDNLGVQETAGS